MAPNARSKSGRRRRKHRARFVAIDLAANADQNFDKIVREARERNCKTLERVRRNDEVNTSTEYAFRDHEQLTELYLRNIPPLFKAPDIVKGLHAALYLEDLISMTEILRVCETSESFPDSPVVRCEIRQRKDRLKAVAFVLVRNTAFSDALLSKSPVSIESHSIHISLSTRTLVPGVGSAWRSRRDPSTSSWRIGMIQFGEKTSRDVFRSFWKSSEHFDLTVNCHIELNPIGRLFALIIGQPQVVHKSCSIPNTFVNAESILRLEIPFRSVSHPPCLERSPLSKQDYAVYFPINKPPFLFRAEGSFIPGPTMRHDLIWDCTRDSFESVRWMRTVDPTRTNAFSCARGIRIMLGTSDMQALFKKLHNMCITEEARPTPVPGSHTFEEHAPSEKILFQPPKTWLNLSFAVRYLVECIVSLRAFSVAKLDQMFWKLLSEQLACESDAVFVLDCMYFRLSDYESYAMTEQVVRVVDPTETLRETIDICNRNGGFEGPEDDAVSDGSIESDESDEYMMEDFFRQLTDSDANDSMDPTHSKSGANDLDGNFNLAGNSETRVRLPTRKYAPIRRLLITPTRVIAQLPEIDLLNRVLRDHEEHHDRFLRISFCDEDGGSIAFTGSDDLYVRIRQVLRTGVEIAGETFVFLAFSNSQLRDHAVWMYNEKPDPLSNERPPPSADDIRKGMGDFSNIRSPGKFAARQGQAFSSTVGTVLLDEVQHHEIPDVPDASGTYMFSDGVGLMSSELAWRVAQKLRLNLDNGVPSAFQVRFGGAKGMLTVWDAAFPAGLKREEKPVEVLLRQSMTKFYSTHKALEIVGYSKRLPMYLNRQIITLLSGLGVPDEVFERLQRKVLLELDRAMDKDGSLVALHLLYTSGAMDSGNKLSSSEPMMQAASFFRAGLTCVNCEHLFNMMYAYRCRMIRELMLRARIPLDADKAVCALGVMDELGVLAANEVFCQFTLPHSGAIRLMRGRVTVGRSPCLHPGDIQPLTAVDKPELHHLVDVIVFPQKGPRPIPSMLSGGDLDGDIYFCILDEIICFPKPFGHEPMNYEPPKPILLSRPVETRDVADFFVKYIRNDKLGVIANAHVVYADKETDGIRSKKCLKLAELHSVAVDFAKTGVPAQIPPDLLPRNVRDEYPDFMGKHAKVSYVSEKVLGKLYRACRARSGNDTKRMHDKKFEPNASSQTIDAIVDSFEVDSELMEDAEKKCHAYNVEMIRLMDQFGVHTEGEVVSGHAMIFSERHAQLRGRREHFALQMRLNRQLHELRKRYREDFFKDLDQTVGGKYTVQTVLKACAWYKACRQDAEEAREAGNPCRQGAEKAREAGSPVLVSFPWVVSDVLLKIIGNELQKR